MDKTDKVIVYTFGLYDEDFATVTHVNKAHNFRNRSLALRQILKEYRELKAAQEKK